jgi:poly-gamma-glutamate capsule biosynthesis protein CapA/YwtB (metallophosphatase superfamily)
MSLQRTRYGATPVIVANRNSYEYAPTAGPTTSYVVMVFTTEPERGGTQRYNDQAVFYFGGDTYIGRGWTDAAQRPATMDWLSHQIRHVTAGNPLLINLEGVVLERQPSGANTVQHLMLARLALPLLSKLRLAAVNLANNHAHDFGEEGLDQTAAHMEAAGIGVLRHGIISDIGALKVLPLTFKRSYFFDHATIRAISELEWICHLQGASPLIVLAHWGDDYTDTTGPFEKEALDHLAKCGVSAVIGAHSHRAAKGIELRAGGALQSVFSMGNLIFDQASPVVSGALVELRVFRQGTIALRIIPIPNFFAMLKSAAPR